MDQFESLPAVLLARAEIEPERIVAEDADGDGASYAQLVDRAARWAAALAGHGAAHGDRVLTMVANSVAALSLWTGISWPGLVEVPINNALRGASLRHIIASARSSIAVVDRPLLATFLAACEGTDVRVVVATGAGEPGETDSSGPEPTSPPGCVVIPSADFLESGTAFGLPQPPRTHDVACVLFTSGTTGPAKGVVIAWGNLRASGLGSLPVGDIGPDDVWYGPGSASHVGAKSMPFLFASLGARTVLRERFSLNSFWPDIRRHGVTSTVLVSAMAHFLMQQDVGPDDAATSLRNVLMVPVIREFAEFNERFGARICTVFNMTELSVPITSGWITSNWQSCGRLRSGYPGYEVQLVDEHDYPVAVGAPGEAVVRARDPWTTNLGYFGLPQASADAWRNGWFHTGDILRADADGNFYFVDRVKDAIRVRGENVSSFEVEAEVLTHPEVAECAAVAVPGAYGDDEIKVFVALIAGSALSAPELVEYLEPRMARHMVPRYFQFIDELPKNWRLRVRKDALRAHPRTAEWDRQTTATARSTSDDLTVGVRNADR